jgi:HSP20 family molecular chaperone IbpA/uncharacterized membrane protein
MAIIEQSIDINVPAHAVYEQLLRFEQYPRFMESVEEVRRLDDRRLRWHTRMGEQDIEWDAEIVEQVPDRSIAWRNVGGPRNHGRVQLQSVGPDRTRITLTLDSEPEPGTHVPGAVVGAVDSEELKEDALAQRTQQDLARFKKFAESMYEGGDGRHAGVHVGGGEPEFASRAGAGQGSAGSHAGGQGTDAYVEQRSGRDRRQRASVRLPNLLQAWNDPVGAMRRMSDEVDQLAQKFIGRPAFGVRARSGGGTADWTPTVEVARRDNRFVVCAELPGVRREDVQIDIRSGRLTIQGERRPRQPQQEPQPQFRRSERAYGHFHRVIALPEGADDDAASASMQDGVLEVTVPVMPDTRPGRRIDIQGS